MSVNELMPYLVPGGIIVGFLVFKRLGQVSRDRAHSLVKDGALLVDVRSKAEYASGHLPGARNVPLPEIGGHIKSLGDKSRPIIVYCASGTRSAVARSVLKGQGFSQVFNLGSMGRW